MRLDPLFGQLHRAQTVLKNTECRDRTTPPARSTAHVAEHHRTCACVRGIRSARESDQRESGKMMTSQSSGMTRVRRVGSSAGTIGSVPVGCSPMSSSQMRSVR
jgi:hypothetical protein